MIAGRLLTVAQAGNADRISIVGGARDVAALIIVVPPKKGT